MTLPTNIDVPCKLLPTPTPSSDGITWRFFFEVIDGNYKGQTFNAWCSLDHLARMFGGRPGGIRMPTLNSTFLIQKRGDTFKFGAPYEPLPIH